MAYQNILDSLYWSDTWQFSTEKVLPVDVKIPNLVVSGDTFTLPVLIDSLENAISFELFLTYDTASIQFLNSQDTLLLSNHLQIIDDNGIIKMLWQSSDHTIANAANISNDTLIQLQFLQLTNCETNLIWNIDTSDFYHINQNINLDAFYQNSHVIFLENEVPQLVFPLHNDTTSLRPDLFWNAGQCVENYHLQVALDNQFTQIVLDTTQSDTTNWLTNLQTNTRYFWRVAKEDYINDWYLSDTFSFVTMDNYNSKLALNNVLTYQNATEITVTIDSVFHLTGFQLEIDYDENEIAYTNFIDPLWNNIQIIYNGNVLKINWLDTLQPKKILFDTLITLTFTNINACQTPLNWNSTNTIFTYRNQAFTNSIDFENGGITFLNTNAPQLQTPFDQATNIFPIVDFNWRSVDCSIEYQLQIAKDQNFTNIVMDSLSIIDTFLTNIILDHNTTYYWRVGRWDTQNDRYWSDTLAFATTDLLQVDTRIEETNKFQDTIEMIITIENLIWA